MFRALIFDMDGLMVDTEPLYWEVARLLAREHGKSVADQTLRKVMGRSRIDSMRIFAEECGITSVTAEQLLEQRERLMLERFAEGVEPMPGLREILARFRGRLRLAVATSSPGKFTDVLLPSLGIADYFDIIQTGDHITHGKPDPEIYFKTMSRLDVVPRQCIVLEDSNAGALAAHRAGAYVIAVPTELTAEQDFGFADARSRNLLHAAQTVECLDVP
jgi:HAD superfamily hydrolase (TIGR01509 family)